MNENINAEHRKIVVNKTARDQSAFIIEKIGCFNNVHHACIKKKLTPDEFNQAYRKTIKNVKQFCDKLLRLTDSRVDRYKDEMEKASS